MALHPDDFATAYRAAISAAEALVAAMAPFADEPCLEEEVTGAQATLENLRFMQPQINEMLDRREAERERARAGYDREVIARENRDNPIPFAAE